MFETVFPGDERRQQSSPERFGVVDEAALDFGKIAEIDFLILALLHGEM